MRHVSDEERWAYEDGFEAGAAVIVGLIGMGEAIRTNPPAVCLGDDFCHCPTEEPCAPRECNTCGSKRGGECPKCKSVRFGLVANRGAT
jgi:hypothetical protein